MPGKKPHRAEKRKQEKFKREHPEGRKAYAKKKREEHARREALKAKRPLPA
jgi:hypothetical protein